MGSRPNTDAKIHKKKVLIIAHHFPPAWGVGSFRVMKYVKYLRKFGWEPVVITAEEATYSLLDKSLEENIPPGIHVYRLPVCRARLINDDGMRWIPYLSRSVRSIVRKENPAVVYLTGGPFYPLIVGPVIKRCFGLPYVIDLRDPWKLAGKTGAIRTIKWRLGELLTSVLEPFVIRNASRVICATEPMCQEYIAAYKNEPPSKFVTITNGYDPEDFAHIQPVQFAQFTIVYTGKWYSAAPGAFLNIRAFFEALRLLVEKGLSIRLMHVGIAEPEVVELAQTIGVSEFVTFAGPKSYNDSLTYARGANLLLVVGGARDFELPVKIFDYIGCRRPILALAPLDGAIAEVVNKIPFAKLIDTQNPAEIAAALEKIYQGRFDVTDKLEFGRQYERERLTEILAGVPNEASASG